MNRKQRRESQKSRKAAAKKSAAGPSLAGLLEDAGRCFDQGRFAEALEFCRRAVDTDPGSFAAQANLGNVLVKLGRADEAADAYVKALAIEPDSVPVLSNLAILKAETAGYDEAMTLYRQILTIDPGDAEAYHDLALIKKFEAGDPDIQAMEALRATPSLGAEKRMYLDFALTKAFEEIGEFERAFTSAAAANRVKRQSLDYDVARDEALTERIIETFDETFLLGAEAANLADETPVFIIGMPRSGTTLVEQIIASHSAAAGAGEVNHLRDVIMGFGGGGVGVQRLSPTGRGFPEGASDLGAKDFRRLGKAYADRLTAAAPGARRITDKMPRNFFFVGLIRLVLPGARIVHCRRHPVATCLSCYQIHFPDGQEFTYDLVELGRYYGLYARLMDHWRQVAPARFLDLRYEDLVAEPEAQIRRLLEFLDLPWESACLEFHKSGRQVRTASAHQIRRPLYKTAVERWRNYEAHLGPLIEALGPLAGT